MKVISFSLFGDNPIYNIGAIKNAELHKNIFEDWEMRVYYNNSVPKETINKLESLNVNVINTNIEQNYINCVWRFLPAEDKNISYFISRDLDSRLNERDLVAVEEWIKSGKDFHIIRDHPYHGWHMNAGMWGCKGGSVPNMSKLINVYFQNKNISHERTADQIFLREVIYNNFALKSLFLHDEFFNWEGIANKIKRERSLDNYQFIGEALDENDIQRGEDPDCQRRPLRQIYDRK